jgi:hypothetical protein
VTAQRRKRRPGIAPTVGLIVEGDAEYEALPLLHRRRLIANCPPLKATNLGGVGSHMAPLGVAKMLVGKVIAHQVAGRNKVVVCIDREQRPECAGKFAQEVAGALAAELAAKGRPAADVHVVIADRTFEAFLLADATGLHARGKFVCAPGFHCFEGDMGRSGKKGVIELSGLLGKPYSKTRDGPTLFAEVDFVAARTHGNNGHGSRSLDKLLRTLGV